MSRAHPISKFNTSLTEFLINALADKYEDAKSHAYRYNNLKVFMDPIRESQPHFYVSIGISEACFAIMDGKKIDGSLGYEDAYVSRWATRTNINKELENHWKLMKDAIAAEQEDDINKKLAAAMRVMRANNSGKEIDVDMTGTGIDKVKRERRTRKSRFQGMKKNTKKSKDK